MGAPKRPAEDELVRRMAAWAAEWQAVAGCTEPADRPRAEAALRALYVAAGRTEPVISWVPSPAAGLLAYGYASTSRRHVVSTWARGDIGNGDNREFNGLARPFGMEPAWSLRLADGLVDRIPAGARRPSAAGGPLAVAAAAFRMSGAGRTMDVVRSVSSRAPLRGRSSDEDDREPTVDAAILATAGAVLGDAWPPIVESLGPDLAGSLFADAVGRVVATVLRSPERRREAVQAMQPGQWDTVTPLLAAIRDVFGGYLWRPMEGRAKRVAQVDTRLELARSAGPWWALDDLAIISERPLLLRRDDQGRPHAADGPAIAWADGLEAYAWRGVAVDPWIITDPGRITVERIDSESNIEVRRVLIERFGEERLLREGGAALVHEDETGRLWRRDHERQSPWRRADEPVVMVEVENSTPEPDGSHKTYFLRVPPATRTAREAVAWTFGLGAVEYRPAAES
jgi:hypothetical protein